MPFYQIADFVPFPGKTCVYATSSFTGKAISSFSKHNAIYTKYIPNVDQTGTTEKDLLI